MLRTLICSLSAIAALGGAAASAAPVPERVAVMVRISDLDLGSPAGAAVALQRIRTAALAACGGEVAARRFERKALLRACVRDATNQAVAASHSATLAALNGAGAAPIHVAAAR